MWSGVFRPRSGGPEGPLPHTTSEFVLASARRDGDCVGVALIRVDRLADQERADCEALHVGALETINRLRRCVDDRLVLVERGVDEDRHTGQLAEPVQQTPVLRMDVTLDGLQT